MYKALELMLSKREEIGDVLKRKKLYDGHDEVFLALKDLRQTTMCADFVFQSRQYAEHLQHAYLASTKLLDRARYRIVFRKGIVNHQVYIKECYKIFGSLCMALQASGHDDEKYRYIQKAIMGAAETINILQESTYNTDAASYGCLFPKTIGGVQRAASILGYISILPNQWYIFRDVDVAIRNSLKGALILSKIISPNTPLQLRADAASGTLYYMKDVLNKIEWLKAHKTLTPFPHMVVIEAVAKFYINAVNNYADLHEYEALEEYPGVTDVHLLTAINVLEGVLIAKEAKEKLMSSVHTCQIPECAALGQIEGILNTAYTKYCLEGFRRTHMSITNMQLKRLLGKAQKKIKNLAKGCWDMTTLSALGKICITTERALDRLDGDRILYLRNYEGLKEPVLPLFPGEQPSHKHRGLRRSNIPHSLTALVEGDELEPRDPKRRKDIREFFRYILVLLIEFFWYIIESVRLLCEDTKAIFDRLRHDKEYASDIAQKEPFWGDLEFTPERMIERSLVPAYGVDATIAVAPDECLPEYLQRIKKAKSRRSRISSQDDAGSESDDIESGLQGEELQKDPEQSDSAEASQNLGEASKTAQDCGTVVADIECVESCDKRGMCA